MKKETIFFSQLEKKRYLCTRFFKIGTLAEWLGTGLQNRRLRFDSGRYLFNETPTLFDSVGVLSFMSYFCAILHKKPYLCTNEHTACHRR